MKMRTRVIVMSLVILGAFDGLISLISLTGDENYRRTRIVAYAEGSCSQCRIREDIRAMSLEAIKKQILLKLDLKSPPNMTGRALPKIPQITRIMDEYEAQSDQPSADQMFPGFSRHEEIDEYAAKTESVIALAQPHPRLRHSSKGNLETLYFNFSSEIMRHNVIGAKMSLWVWAADRETPSSSEPGKSNNSGQQQQEQQQQQQRGPVTVILQRMSKGLNGDLLLGQPYSTKYPRPHGKDGAWITIDVKKMVTEWFKVPANNTGVALRIQLGSNHRRSNYNRIVELDTDSEHTPYIEVQIEDIDEKRGGRVKRMVGMNCDENSANTLCCRYRLTVDFEKLGWDWIIAPKKYDANYCSGECPLSFMPTFPNTHIVSLSNATNSSPCCAPRTMSQISMLYFDNQYQIVFSKLPGMVVERCGCS